MAMRAFSHLFINIVALKRSGNLFLHKIPKQSIMKTNSRKEETGSMSCNRVNKRIGIILAASLSILMILPATVSIGKAQESKKLTRKEKEEAWRAERLKKRAAEEQEEMRNDSIEYVQAIEAIRNGSWALEASNITFDNGVTRFVTPSTNFVSINNGDAVVQTAFNNSNIYSPNGIGGITVEGSITGEELKMDHEGNIYYNYSIMGPRMSATVSVVVTAHSNQATATVDPNFSSRNMTMSGYIYPYESAGVFEGTPDY